MIIIPGFTPDDKVPGVVAINQYGAGRQSIGAQPLVCLGIGTASGGTAEAGQRYAVTTPEEADTLFEARSELARMMHAALDVPGVTLYGVAVAPPEGAESATLVLEIGGSWSTGGEITLQLDEEIIRIAVAASHTPTTFGDAVEDAVNAAQSGRLFCSASNSAGTVTLTVYSTGIRGNQHIGFLDASKRPSGMTASFRRNTAVARAGGTSGPAVTVAGADSETAEYVVTITTGGANDGTAKFSITANGESVATGEDVPASPGTYSVPGTDSLVVTFADGSYVQNETYTWTTSGNNPNAGVFFAMGSGTDDIDDALDELESVTNDYVAPAANDATNVGKLEAHVNAKAAFDVARLENYVVATNGTQAAAIAIGQTTMNDVLGCAVWDQYGVEHPSRTAIRLAALFSVTEGAQPNFNYDGIAVPGAAPHVRDADSPNRATLKTALNNSLTPLVTVNGTKQIVRAITSRSLNGANADYRSLDRATAIVPIRVRKELVAIGTTMKEANPFAGPDVGEGLPPDGTFTPRLWNSRVQAELERWASPEFNWLTDVENNLPESVWDNDAKRVMSIVPTIVKPQNHQLGIIVRQTAA